MTARPPMPPTTDPASLVRRASTNRIQGALQGNPPGYLGPPIHQPPGASITPFSGQGTGTPGAPDPSPFPATTGQSSDPFTAGSSFGTMPPNTPYPHDPGPSLIGPPTHQATPFPYQAFQNALQQSGRGGFTPSAGQGDQGLPGEGGPPDAVPFPTPSMQPPGPHDEMGVDPANYVPPAATLGTSPSDPPPDTTQDPVDLGGGDPNYDPASGIGNSPPPTGHNFPTLGGGPWVPSTGGIVGTGTTDPRPWYNQASEPWYGRVARSVMPYGSGQLAHLAMRAAMANRGTVGGPARAVHGNNPSSSSGGPETPAQRAFGDRNWGMGGGSIPGASMASNSHFNYGTGRYEADRNPGRGFAGSPNQGQAAQASSPVIPGMNVGGDAGHIINTTGAWQNHHVDAATARALRAWSAAHTTVRSLYGG